jgi:hypothetical protein
LGPPDAVVAVARMVGRVGAGFEGGAVAGQLLVTVGEDPLRSDGIKLSVATVRDHAD